MIDVDYNEYKETLEENMKLTQENHELKEKIKHLQELYNVALKDYDKATEKIDKTIEYIEEKEKLLLNCDDEWLDHDEMIDKKRFKKILEMLKGESNE